MDMKCKKLILLAMRMNNANHKKLKFTRTRIVNLEMFFKVSIDICLLFYQHYKILVKRMFETIIL